MKSEIVIKQERRPCFIAYPGQNPIRCMFHQWCNEVERTNEGKERQQICALLETESGRMLKIRAELVRFADHLEFVEYVWPGENKDEH